MLVLKKLCSLYGPLMIEVANEQINNLPSYIYNLADYKKLNLIPARSTAGY